LQYLHLANNSFTGLVPPSIGNISTLESLNLRFNFLEGRVPEEIGHLPKLKTLRMGFNNLLGSILPTFLNISSLQWIDFTSNMMSGGLPEDLCVFHPKLEFLALSRNEFDGQIPSTLGECRELQIISLSYNKFTGFIPKAIGNLTLLQILYLGSNNFKGKKRVALTLYILLPIVSILLAMAFVLLFVKCRRRNKTPSNVDLLPKITPPRITYQQLFRATNGFSESNLLGVGSFGSVYKPILGDITVLAIKVFNLQVEGAFKSFEIECKIMRRIHHRNLTKVISSCSNLDFKVVVLEYMPNGSLDKWLHSYNYFLDMLQGLDIMIDVACALQYLYHDYSMPLVHYDLKPSNILLDNDMVAHVSDFGIAKLLLDLGECVTHTKTIATFGYIAPEGLVSTSCDVYSYGILLMETFTRVMPTDEMFFEDMTMKHWIRESLPNAISYVVDVNLLKPEEEHVTAVVLQCVSFIMELALSCFAESSKERINMKDVLTTLKKIKIWYLANCGRS
ncbi:putative LRR receptor-like serine/threonine-protein kinase, partial [Camellia lanceoleosa]